MFTPSHIILLIVILAIVLVVFGASRLGDVGGALGRSVREFKQEVRTNESDKPSDGSSTTS